MGQMGHHFWMGHMGPNPNPNPNPNPASDPLTHDDEITAQ